MTSFRGAGVAGIRFLLGTSLPAVFTSSDKIVQPLNIVIKIYSMQNKKETLDLEGHFPRTHLNLQSSADDMQ